MPAGSSRNSRCGPRLQRRPRPGNHLVRRRRDSEFSPRRTAANRFSAPNKNPGSSIACEIPKPPGKSGATRSPRSTCAPTHKICRRVSPSPGPAPAMQDSAARISSTAYLRARRNLRFRPRPRHHRLRHRRRRPPQFLGWPRRQISSAQAVRTSRHCLRHRLDFSSGPGRSLRARLPERSSDASVFRRPRTGGLQPATDGQSAASPRRQVLPRIREKRRPAKARAVSNPDLSPHVSFVDMGGHGYAIVTATSNAFETEFVCIPRPLERSATPTAALSAIARSIAPLSGPKAKPQS